MKTNSLIKVKYYHLRRKRYYGQKYISIIGPNNFSGWDDMDEKRTNGDKIFEPKTEEKILSLIIVLVVMRTLL